jgi:hypothetical protein
VAAKECDELQADGRPYGLAVCVAAILALHGWSTALLLCHLWLGSGQVQKVVEDNSLQSVLLQLTADAIAADRLVLFFRC